MKSNYSNDLKHKNMNVCMNNKNTLYNHDLNVCIADPIYLIEVSFKQKCDKRSGATALLF